MSKKENILPPLAPKTLSEHEKRWAQIVAFEAEHYSWHLHEHFYDLACGYYAERVMKGLWQRKS